MIKISDKVDMFDQNEYKCSYIRTRCPHEPGRGRQIVGMVSERIFY